MFIQNCYKAVSPLFPYFAETLWVQGIVLSRTKQFPVSFLPYEVGSRVFFFGGTTALCFPFAEDIWVQPAVGKAYSSKTGRHSWFRLPAEAKLGQITVKAPKQDENL